MGDYSNEFIFIEGRTDKKYPYPTLKYVSKWGSWKNLIRYHPFMWSASMSGATWLLSDESPDRPDWCWLVLAAVTGSWRRLMFSAPRRVFMNLNTKISSSLTFSANGRETRGAQTREHGANRACNSLVAIQEEICTNISTCKVEILKMWETERDIQRLVYC